MKRVLKIGGIIAGVIVALIIGIAIVIIFISSQKSYLSGGSMSFEDNSISAAGAKSYSSSKRLSSNSMMMEGGSSIPIQSDKKVIKNGSLKLKVDKVDEAVEEIGSIARNKQGEIFSSNIRQNIKNIKNGSITVKVPVANFEKAFSEIKEVASLVLNESTSGRDVTEQYSDLQAQLRNKKAEEFQFAEILKQAKKIQDILAVTQQLSRVRGEIERLEGKIKYLDSQTEMSTINISLSEDQDITVVDSWRPWQEIKNSFNSLIKNLQGSINFIIRLLIIIIPVLIIWGLILWVIYIIGKRIYLKIKK